MKIGLFGGTFDPLHIGHLVAVRLAKEELQLDRVIIIPAGVPPHKLEKKITPPEKRLQMVKVSVEGEADFCVSDWEIMQDKPSFTVDTLEYFASQYPHDELYFIMGADMICDLPNWKLPERIFQLASIVGMKRPGFALYNCGEELQKQYPLAQNKIIYVEMPGLEISSTWLRERLHKGLQVDNLIPQQVVRYIKENGLYE